MGKIIELFKQAIKGEPVFHIAFEMTEFGLFITILFTFALKFNSITMIDPTFDGIQLLLFQIFAMLLYIIFALFIFKSTLENIRSFFKPFMATFVYITLVIIAFSLFELNHYVPNTVFQMIQLLIIMLFATTIASVFEFHIKSGIYGKKSDEGRSTLDQRTKGSR